MADSQNQGTGHEGAAACTLTAAVHHNGRVVARACLLDAGRRGLDVLRGVVRALGAATEDDVHILDATSVSTCPRRDNVVARTWLPRVLTMAASPCSVTPMNACGFELARIASTATDTLPSVPFLNPMGNDTPDASSRCSCDSVVRAPIAPHEVRSEMYCGEIVSSSSDPTGTPMCVRSHSSWRAMRRPLLIWNEPSMSGSLIRPFQPTVVRGFWADTDY